MTSAPRSYQDALNVLNTFQSNAAVIKQWKEQRRADFKVNLKDEIKVLCQRAGLDLDKLAKTAIHVAGTKGKGSTCAITESIVRSHGYTTGMFTSPHLIHVRERIRLNGRPISKTLFAKYFFNVYDALEESQAESEYRFPSYFKFLTVMAFKTFQEENVDCSIVEVGIGGRTDTTNVLPSAVVTAITTLDLDHVEILGDTLPLIAREKAGIMKKGVPMISTPQEPEQHEVLVHSANESGALLYTAQTWRAIRKISQLKASDPRIVGLAGSYQLLNASVAIALAHVWIQNKLKLPPSPLPESSTALYPLFELTTPYLEGLQNCCWPGRAQKLVGYRGLTNVTFLLDGAHTPASLLASTEWYLATVAEDPPENQERILCFNCKTSKPSKTLLNNIFSRTQGTPYSSILFTASKVRRARDHSNDITNIINEVTSQQKALDTQWHDLHSAENVSSPPTHVFAAIDDCLEHLYKAALEHPEKEYKIHVTGSLYLVGGFLDCLDFHESALRDH